MYPIVKIMAQETDGEMRPHPRWSMYHAVPHFVSSPPNIRAGRGGYITIYVVRVFKG